MHTIKITPNLLFVYKRQIYQIAESNRIEFFWPELECSIVWAHRQPRRRSYSHPSALRSPTLACHPLYSWPPPSWWSCRSSRVRCRPVYTTRRSPTSCSVRRCVMLCTSTQPTTATSTPIDNAGESSALVGGRLTQWFLTFFTAGKLKKYVLRNKVSKKRSPGRRTVVSTLIAARPKR